MDVWEQRELELSQKHAEILKIRETILRGSERYYDAQNARSSSFISDYKKAKERNLQLLHDIAHVSELLHSASDEDGHSQKQFNTLKTNYWGMIRNVFPVWLEEQKQYEQKHGLPLSSRSTRDEASNLLPRPSPRSSAKSPQNLQRVSGSPRPGSRTDTRASDGGDTTRTIPPLDLDFSMGEDLTISQGSALKGTQESAITPKSALTSSTKLKNSGMKKTVQIKEDGGKKERERLKKEQERQKKEAEKQRKIQEKEKRAAEKAKKKSARSNASK